MKSLFAEITPGPIVGTVIYSLIGIAIFILAYALIQKLSPFSVQKEISEDQNVALGIIIGSVIIGLSIIIAAAIHG
jgi:putative membrane protein